MRHAFSVHVHVAEVLAGTGVYKVPKLYEPLFVLRKAELMQVPQ